MPASLQEIEGTGAIAILHFCEVCSKAAHFGIGGNINKALIAHSKGKFDLAKELLGKWYCYEHRKNN